MGIESLLGKKEKLKEAEPIDNHNPKIEQHRNPTYRSVTAFGRSNNNRIPEREPVLEGNIRLMGGGSVNVEQNIRDKAFNKK
jgi:hypothetical protein